MVGFRRYIFLKYIYAVETSQKTIGFKQIPDVFMIYFLRISLIDQSLSET